MAKWRVNEIPHAHLGHTRRVIALKSTMRRKNEKQNIIELVSWFTVGLDRIDCLRRLHKISRKFEGKQYEFGIELKDDGSFSVFASDTTLITGTYKVDGNVFTETSTLADAAPMWIQLHLRWKNLTF
ncbi:MAG: hypothetical protein IPJ46_10510 [Anaerolineales bacterium]|nr:hypothetical protein [Anaerolineales bacterium]